MKNIITIVFSLVASVALAYAPLECRPTRAECQVVFDDPKGKDCFVAPQDFCDAEMFRYEKQERVKEEMRKPTPDQGYIGIVEAAKTAADLPLDSKYNWATTSDPEPTINPQGGFIPVGLLGVMSVIALAVMAFLGIRKKNQTA